MNEAAEWEQDQDGIFRRLHAWKSGEPMHYEYMTAERAREMESVIKAAEVIVHRLIADDGDSHWFVVRQELKAELLAYGEAIDLIQQPTGVSV